MKIEIALAFFLTFAGTSVAGTIQKADTTQIQPNSAIYFVPSAASDRLTHYVEHPPRWGWGKRLREANFEIVPEAKQAKYSVSCEVISGGTHNDKALVTFGGAVGMWMPLTVQMAVHNAATGELVASETKDIREGSMHSKQKANFEALYCADQLSLLMR